MMGRIGERLRRAAFAPLRWLLPRRRGARVALFCLLALAALALLAPGLRVLLHAADVLLRLLDPLLATAAGRILVAGTTLALATLATWWLARDRVRRFLDEAAIGRHLAAVAALAVEDSSRARAALQRVARRRQEPARCGWLAADASLKLARDALARGRIAEALGWLERVREPGLPAELLRSLWQLRAVAWRRQGAVLPAQLLAEVSKALAQFHDDHVLAEEGLALAMQVGAPAAIAAAHERCARTAPPSRRDLVVARWLDGLQAAGAAAIARGDFAAARRTAKALGAADPTGLHRGLLVGDVHAAEGDARKALAAWGATGSWEALERAAALVASRPDAVEPQSLLELVPLQGALLLVARELARRGDGAGAERAARLAATALGPTPTAMRLLAEVADTLGHGDEAVRLRVEAQRRLLAGESGAGGGT